MAGPSSTSSSSARHPIFFGLLPLFAVLALVLLADDLLWDHIVPWERIEVALRDCGGQCRVVRSKAWSEVELARMRVAEPDRWRVVVVGSSRAGAGFLPQRLPANDPALATLHLFKVSVAATEPYTMRSLASRLDAGEVDEVVLYLSEFDTHRPPYLVPTVGYGGPGAWIDLVRFGGPRFVWRHRDPMVRLALASVLDTYRNRDVLAALGRNFALPLDRGDADGDGPPPFRNALAARPPDSILPAEEFERISDEIRLHFDEAVAEGSFQQVRTISRGRHVALQEALVRATIDVLVARAIRVVIVEPPLHPQAERLYDLATRSDFRRFADELALLPGVEFLGLAQQPAFREDEFSDLTHLNETGALRHTQIVVECLARHARAASRAPRP